MTYQELKEYFHGRELPKELRTEHIWFKDLPFAVAYNFEKIESEIEKHGPKGVKKSAIAGASKARLNEIVRILEG
jgi:hypothetical protein